MSRRVSLDEDAYNALMAESEHFQTQDVSKLIIGLLAERKLLMRCIQPLQPSVAEPPQPSRDATLDDLQGLLED
jgi:hypothetical protein